MSILYQALPGNLTDAENFPAVLKSIEGFVEGIYDDGKHIATIGIGTNVQDVRAYLALTLKELGVFTTIANETDAQRNQRYNTIITRFSDIITNYDNRLNRDVQAYPTPGTSPSEKALQAKLDAELAQYLPGAEFKIPMDKAANIVGQIVNGFIIAPDTDSTDGKDNGTFLKTEGIATTLDNRLAEYEVVIDHNTKEYLALLSLQFNTKAGESNLIGNDLRQALKDGNRAEVWFEIRYYSNLGSLSATPPSIANGTAKRRYYEAEIFGLYDSGDSARDKTEAMQVYRCTQHIAIRSCNTRRHTGISTEHQVLAVIG